MKKTDFVTEGTTTVNIFKKKNSKKGPGSKQGVPFYNPSMEMNRDISILIAQWLVNNSKNKLKILDGLGASGIRGIRIFDEVNGNFEVTINDWNEEAFDLIKKNVKEKYVIIKSKNLNALLSEERFDYIDIDPFGSPVYFFDSAIRGINNNGIIAATATDTATLCGVYPKACIRRYNAKPFHCNVMKEIGLRILIGSICKTAAKFDKGIEPILSYTTDHYFRIYVKIHKGVKKANKSIENVKRISTDEPISHNKKVEIGPLWMKKLHNKKAIMQIRSIISDKTLGSKNQLWKYFDLFEEEANAESFFYLTDELSKYLKKSVPKLESIISKLKSNGFNASRTHFTPTGFKTNATINDIKKIF